MKKSITTLHRFAGGTVCTGALVLMAGNASAQNLFISNIATGNVDKFTSGGTSSPFATGLNHPFGIAFDSSGDLFIADSANNAGGGNITEITSGGVTSIFSSESDPTALAFNSTGNLFAADYSSGNIYEYIGGVATPFAAGLDHPLSLAFDSTGNLFVGAGGASTGTITKIASDGTKTPFASGLSFPGGLAFNTAGTLFVSSQTSGTIFEYTPGGVQSTFTTVGFDLNGLVFNSAGILFASAAHGPIIEIAPDTTESTFAPDSGTPVDLAFQPVPEPSVWGLLGTGAALLASRSLRRNKSVLR